MVNIFSVEGTSQESRGFSHERFKSYSHEDMDKVYPILNKLHENRYRLWYDRHIESGTKWAEDIHEWLTHQNCSKFVIFIGELLHLRPLNNVVAKG